MVATGLELPLLDIVTRHLVSPRRVRWLHRQRKSLQQLQGKDWVQTLLIDPHGRGIAGANTRLQTYEPAGRYIWLLDDDDVCLEPGLLDLIDPTCDMQIFKIRYVTVGYLPDKAAWEAREIRHEKISCQCCILRRDLWLATRQAWGPRYECDYEFYKAAFDAASNVTWTDRPIAHLVTHNYGQR